MRAVRDEVLPCGDAARVAARLENVPDRRDLESTPALNGLVPPRFAGCCGLPSILIGLPS